MGFLVGTPLISPVGDRYIETKKYDPVTIDGDQHARIRFSGEERVAIAEATATDLSEHIQVLDYEITNSSVPNGSQTRGYIEHTEMLEFLQRKAIEKNPDDPDLYVLVGGADLANASLNWTHMSGMPFLVATRITDENRTGSLKHTVNMNFPLHRYLEYKFQYTEKNQFANFKSGSFQCPNNAYSSLSSTKIANCDPVALNLMSNGAFAKLTEILKQRANQSSSWDNDQEAQRQTAIATLRLYKKYAQDGTFQGPKKEIVDALQTYPASYQKIWDSGADSMGSIRALLDDYTKSNSAPNRFFHGHWNRHYVAAVADIVKMIDDGETNITKVRDELAKIKPTNLEGSLARRMDFIAKELGPIDRNQASEFAHPSPTA